MTRRFIGEKAMTPAEKQRRYRTTLAEQRLRQKTTTAQKQESRAKREAELGAKQCALPSKRYGVILADPAWRFEPYSRKTGMDRAADNHYPTSSLDLIKALNVGSIAAKDAVLFFWATAPMLPQALEVMRLGALPTNLISSGARAGQAPAIGIATSMNIYDRNARQHSSARDGDAMGLAGRSSDRQAFGKARALPRAH